MTGTTRVRVGLIGVGRYAGMAHIPALHTCSAASVTAVCDVDPSALRRVADGFGVDIDGRFPSADGLIASGRVDAVIVSTPNTLHYSHVRAAIDHNLHVLVDKPFVLRTDEALELRDLANARGRVLMVGYNRHYDPGSLYVRDQIQSGALGAIRFVRTVQRGLSLVDVPWYGDPALAGGRMLTMRGTHMADLVRWLIGVEIESVTATIRWVDETRSLDGDTVAVLRMTNGSLAEIVCLEENGDANIDEVWVYGSVATLRLARIPRSGNTWRLFDPAPDGGELRDLTLPLGGNLTHTFIDVIRGEAENRSTATDGVAAVRLIEAIYESARGGRSVPLWPNGGPS